MPNRLYMDSQYKVWTTARSESKGTVVAAMIVGRQRGLKTRYSGGSNVYEATARSIAIPKGL
jgi:hypothetical protein